jgi:hypothetical protein
MSDHNFIRLRAFILGHSASQDWATARLEWTLAGVEDLGRERDACPCGYEPIRHLCWLSNIKTNAHVFVGNVCVNRFLPEHDSSAVVAGLRRIQRDVEKAPNPALLIWARKAGVISEWEFSFGMDTSRKRALSARQAVKRNEINRRIAARLVTTQRAAAIARGK